VNCKFSFDPKKKIKYDIIVLAHINLFSRSSLTSWRTYPVYVIVHQVDVEVTFEVPSMEGMEVVDPTLANDTQELCNLWGADKKGGVSPFGAWVLA
jgi:hypothetical protein